MIQRRPARSMSSAERTIVETVGVAIARSLRPGADTLARRALVGRPRVVFFDEATSALDNETQAIVSRSLEELQATRVVIAHRLSTVRRADRVIVIDKGRVVEQGTYDDVLAQGGVFAQLVGRQELG